MTLVDLAIIIFVAALAGWGFKQGAVMGVSSLAGFLTGVYFGTRLGNNLLEGGNESPYAPLFALVIALVIGVISAEISVALGYRFRVRFTSLTARRVDGTVGAVLLGAFALMIVWVGAAALNQSKMTGELRTSVRRSALVKELNAVLPPSGPLISAISRIDPVPSISGPSTNVAAPDPGTASDPDVQRAAQSTVRVLGTACGYGVEGSGWVAAPGLIVTNAHVVAGQSDTTVQPVGEGAAYRAVTVWFDPRNDLALLSAPEVASPPLPLTSTTDKGTAAAIVGYPLNGSLTISSARIGGTQNAISDDIYGGGPITRKMTSFRGLVRQGNSGGPLIDADGRVRSTVFASQSGSDNRRGYGVPGTVIAEALGQVNTTIPVSTGACT